MVPFSFGAAPDIMSKLTLVIAAVVLAGCAAIGGWRDLRVDASSPDRFEDSIASFQRELSGKRRDLFDISLTTLWLLDTRDVDGGDVNGDGKVDVLDFRALERAAVEARRELRRGVPMEDNEAAENYRARLDGLGYDEIVRLSGLLTEELYDAAFRAVWAPTYREAANRGARDRIRATPSYQPPIRTSNDHPNRR